MRRPTKKKPVPQKYMRLADVATHFGLSHDTVYRMAAAGKMQTIRLNRLILVEKVEVERLELEAKKKATDE